MATVAVPEDAAGAGTGGAVRPPLPDSGPAAGQIGARAGFQPLLRTVAATTAVGLGLGLLVGGIGGRLAMRALFLTSDPSVRGLVSDDGFPIGRFDVASTLNLLAVGTVIGVIGAFVYLAVRPFLMGPVWLRRAGCGIGAGAVVGSMLVGTDGVDFTLLGPRWFAIALFVALPALFGVLAAIYVERAIRSDGWFMAGPARLALLPLAAFVFLPLLVVIGVPVLLVLAARTIADVSPGWARLLRSPAARWTGRSAFAAVAVAGLWALIGDTFELLTTT